MRRVLEGGGWLASMTGLLIRWQILQGARPPGHPWGDRFRDSRVFSHEPETSRFPEPTMKKIAGVLLAACVVTSIQSRNATAQLISIKTVPVATGNQFLLYPSANLGMAGVSVAIDDHLLDPFVNPAKGSRLEGSRLFGSPTFYGISDRGPGGRTLPLGATFAGQNFFGAVSASLQQLDRNGQGFCQFGGCGITLSDSRSTNQYLHGMVGSRLGNADLSVGVSVSWADLNAVEGVDLLYGLAESIDQFGSALDVRIGVLKDGSDGSSFEAIALFNRFKMTHDVTQIDWFRDDILLVQNPIRTVERNLDRTNTFGLHFGYQRPLAGSDWRIGGILTANYKSHPKIPNYEVMNIPRDPGYSWAYNIGVGLSREMGPARFAVEIVYEPIVSSTWAEAAEPVQTESGRTLAVGAKTIENDFQFSNATFRMGISRETQTLGFQIGLEVRSINYDLDQVDNVLETFRHQQENWMEWTPTIGLTLIFPEFQIRYTGMVTSGTGRPGVVWSPRAVAAFDTAGDVIVAPSGPLTLQDATVVTHRVVFVMPIK